MKSALYFGFFFIVAQSLMASASIADGKRCTYELEKESVHVGWTAFKTTQKLAVNGAFKGVHVEGGHPQAETISDLLQGLKVTVDAFSVDTANPARDKTLVEFFFKKLSPVISGEVKSASVKDQSFILQLSLNGRSREIPFHYHSDDRKNFKASGTLNITEFGAQKALMSLNKQCYDLHKGPDGVSKTWSEVELNLSGALVSHCQ
jgi:polyisoprenoid-binding protein YceI